LASNFCIAGISCAQVIVIATLWNVEAANFCIADIISAFVVVIAQFSLVPALWKSCLAFLYFGLHAFKFAIAILESLTFAVSTEPNFSAFSNVFFVAISLVSSTEIENAFDTFWRSDVFSSVLSSNAVFSFLNVALAQVLAMFFCVTKKLRSLAACCGVANVFFTELNFFFNTILANLGLARAFLFSSESAALLLCSVVTFCTVFKETASFLASCEFISVASFGFLNNTVFVFGQVAGDIIASDANSVCATFETSIFAGYRVAASRSNTSLFAGIEF